MLERDKAYDIYRRASAGYFGPLTATCETIRNLAELAARIPAAGYWTESDTADVTAIFNVYNRLGRIIARADRDAYPIGLTPDGLDIVIYAPPSTNADEIAANALGVLWMPIVAGIALVTGALAAVVAMRNRAGAKQAELADKLITADKAMITADPATRAIWSNWKRQNADQLEAIDAANPGLIDSLTSSGLALGKLALVAAGIYLAAKIVTRGKQTE